MCLNFRLCGMKFVNNVFFVEEIVLCILNEKKYSVKIRMNEGGLLYVILESFKLCVIIFYIYVV